MWIMILSDLIPSWCEGIDPAFWATETGQIAALELWLSNRGDAISISKAAFMLYGKSRHSHRLHVWELLPVYYFPKRAIFKPVELRSAAYYVLLRDVNEHIFKRRVVSHPFFNLRQPVKPFTSGKTWDNVG